MYKKKFTSYDYDKGDLFVPLLCAKKQQSLIRGGLIAIFVSPN